MNLGSTVTCATAIYYKLRTFDALMRVKLKENSFYITVTNESNTLGKKSLHENAEKACR